MKVLHIMSGFGGGISSFILDKAEYFQNTDISFDVMTFNKVPPHFLNAIRATGGEIHTISNPKKESFLTFYQQVNQIMRKLPKNTFVHCHLIGYHALPFYLIARKNGLSKFAIHAHTTGLPEEINTFKNRLTRFMNNRMAKAKISCSEKSSKYLFGKKSVENKEVMHVPNSINPDRFLVNESVDKSTILGQKNKDKFVIGHIGRFTTVKNHKFMLDIIEKLTQTSLNFIWIFIGDGNKYEEIKSLATEKNLDEYTLFLGRRTDIPELLQIMDVFVLPSKYEGFPTVAVESQASSVKTVLSNSITKEVDLELGLVDFLPVNDPGAWAEHIINNQEVLKIKTEDRLQALQNKNVTNKTSAELYLNFLKIIMSNKGL